MTLRRNGGDSRVSLEVPGLPFGPWWELESVDEGVQTRVDPDCGG